MKKTFKKNLLHLVKDVFVIDIFKGGKKNYHLYFF